MEKKSLSDYVSLIDKLIADGNFEPAYHHACYLLSQFPKFAALYRRIGRIQIELKNFDQAIEIYLRQAAVTPGDWQVFFTLAILYHQKERPVPAARYIAYARLLQPANRDIVRLYRRLKPEEDERLKTDLSLFKEAVETGKKKDAPAAAAVTAEISDPGIRLLAALNLAANSDRRTENGREINETILRKLPYCRQALMTLIGIYAKENDLTRFQRCADRLNELDPERSCAPVEDDSVAPVKKPIALTYFDWTGYPNTRVRSIWQQAQSRYISIDADRVTGFLDLIPIPIDFVVSDPSEEPVSDRDPGEFFRQDDRKSLGSTSEEDDLFFQQDYFRTQSAQLSALLSAPPSESENPSGGPETKSPPSENSAQILDDAFDFLEKIVTEGFAPEEEDPIARTFGFGSPSGSAAESDGPANGRPDAVPDESAGAPISGSPERTAASGTEPEARDENEGGENRARDAWTTFSRGQQSEAIEKYRALIRDRIETDQVRGDLRTLALVFPENDALSELLRTLDEQNELTP